MCCLSVKLFTAHLTSLTYFRSDLPLISELRPSLTEKNLLISSSPNRCCFAKKLKSYRRALYHLSFLHNKEDPPANLVHFMSLYPLLPLHALHPTEKLSRSHCSSFRHSLCNYRPFTGIASIKLPKKSNRIAKDNS